MSFLDPLIGIELPAPKKAKSSRADYQKAYYWANLEKCRKWRRESQARLRNKSKKT